MTETMTTRKPVAVGFLKKDIIAALAYWIIQQSKVYPARIHSILKAAESFIDKVIEAPRVRIPDFVYYEVDKASFKILIDCLCHDCPEIASLNERSEENESDFIDLGALARNIVNSVIKENDSRK